MQAIVAPTPNVERQDEPIGAQQLMRWHCPASHLVWMWSSWQVSYTLANIRRWMKRISTFQNAWLLWV